MNVVFENALAALPSFKRCESGAVTVDWVVLTAVVVVMLILTAAPVFQAGEATLGQTAQEISAYTDELFN